MVKKITPDPPPCITSSLEEKAAYLSKVMHESLAQIESSPVPIPLESLVTTAFTSDSPSSPLFSIQPGVCAQTALTQVSQLLKSAELNADELCPRLSGFERDLLMGVIHAVSLSHGVVEALLGDSGHS